MLPAADDMEHWPSAEQPTRRWQPKKKENGALSTLGESLAPIHKWSVWFEHERGWQKESGPGSSIQLASRKEGGLTWVKDNAATLCSGNMSSGTLLS
jgi:hypothetical protein